MSLESERHAHPVDPERVAAAQARMLSAEEAGALAGLLGLLADPTAPGSCMRWTWSRSCASGTWRWRWAGSARTPSRTRCGCCVPPAW